MLRPLTHSPLYRDFIEQRDKALEQILQRYLDGIDRVMDSLRRAIDQQVMIHYPTSNPEFSRDKVGQFTAGIDKRSAHTALQIEVLIDRLRMTSYIMTRVGEAEAIGRALQKPTRAHIPLQDLQQVKTSKMASGGTVHARVSLALSRVVRSVTDAFQMSLSMGDGMNDARLRVIKAFPKQQKIKVPRRTLNKPRRIHESDNRIPRAPIATGYVGEKDWKDTVEDYLSDNDVTDRGGNDRILFFDVDKTGDVEFHQRYMWDIEQEVTHDFVQQVRDGQVDAANDNGIDDFQWVAVIDGKTDDCCADRDGLSSAEIEAGLESGDIDSECDAIVPPAHFNCRCRVVPMAQDIPERQDVDFSSFDDWLEAS